MIYKISKAIQNVLLILFLYEEYNFWLNGHHNSHNFL